MLKVKLSWKFRLKMWNWGRTYGHSHRRPEPFRPRQVAGRRDSVWKFGGKTRARGHLRKSEAKKNFFCRPPSTKWARAKLGEVVNSFLEAFRRKMKFLAQNLVILPGSREKCNLGSRHSYLFQKKDHKGIYEKVRLFMAQKGEGNFTTDALLRSFSYASHFLSFVCVRAFRP